MKMSDQCPRCGRKVHPPLACKPTTEQAWMTRIERRNRKAEREWAKAVAAGKKTSAASRTLPLPLVVQSGFQREWLQGFAYALAEVQRTHDQPSTLVYVMRAAGLKTIAPFVDAGVDEFDLKQLRKILKELR